MKRVMMIFLCVCVLSASALAVDRSDYEILSEDGTIIFDEDSYNAAVAAEKIAAAGLDLDADAFWAVDWLNNHYFDNDAFEAAYSAALEKLSAESVGNTDANNVGSIQESDDKYPVGSYVDSDGYVWSSDGELLSDGSSTTTYALENDSVSSDVLDTSDEDETVSDEATSTVYNVVDMRSSSDSAVSAYSVETSSDYVLISNSTGQIDFFITNAACYASGGNYTIICNDFSIVSAYLKLLNNDITSVSIRGNPVSIIESGDERLVFFPELSQNNYYLVLSYSDGSTRQFNFLFYNGYVPSSSDSGSSSTA